MKKIDLHIHTHVSADGSYSVSTIMEIAKKQQMDVIAIADHNSVRAVKQAVQIGKETGIDVIPAIEIDCVFQGVNFHMTAYGIDVDDVRYALLEEEVLRQNREVSCKGTMRFLDEMKLNISEEALKSISVNGIIVAEDLCDYLLNHSEFDQLSWLDPYRRGGVRSDNPNVNFYWDYFSQGKIGYVKAEKKSADEMIELIHSTGGKAVIAHPGVNFKNKDEVLEEILEKVDGVEVFSTYHSEEDILKYHELAKKHHCFVTAGSDFHGHHKPAIEMGKIPGVNEKTSQELMTTLKCIACAGTKKKKLMISACLMGINCRYDGGNTRLDCLDKLKQRFNLIPVCPETLAGLPCPRHPLEIVNGRVFNIKNEDYTEMFHKGADDALRQWQEAGCPVVLLQSRSPSCGKGLIYDGSFTGKKISGNGVFTAKLLEHHAEVYSELELDELMKKA